MDGHWMDDYTPLGIEKIARQAGIAISGIRCPRDGVVMRVLTWRARRRDGSDETRRGAGRPPVSKEWAVTQLDVECPACRRRAEGVTVIVRAARTAVPA
jgi:hypothetical protein